MTETTITHSPGRFVIRCKGKLSCICGEPVISTDVELEEISDAFDDKVINGLRLVCSACHVDLLEVGIC